MARLWRPETAPLLLVQASGPPLLVLDIQCLKPGDVVLLPVPAEQAWSPHLLQLIHADRPDLHLVPS